MLFHFQFGYFCQTALVPFCAGKSRYEKGFYEFPRERIADYTATEADNVEVIILNPLMS